MVFKNFFFNRSKYNTIYGSRLQNKIFLMFGVLSSIPALILTILAIIFSYYMINSWFNTKITSVLNESAQIAESYLKENQESVKTKATTIANELDVNISRHELQTNLPVFTDVLNSLVSLNDISEAVVFQGHIPLIKSQFGNSLSLESIPNEYYLEALHGKVASFKTPKKIRAIIALHAIPNTFLVIGKYIDDKATEHIKKSTAIIGEYNAIRRDLRKLQFEFCLVFFILAAALLCIANVMGASLSKDITKPIIRLVEATNSVKDGKFDIKLPDGPKNDEIGNLSRSFNLMAQKVSDQQKKLLRVCDALDRKKRFVEMVLSGISTGVIAASRDHKVELINDAGGRLLLCNKNNLHNSSLSEIFPECIPIVEEVSNLRTKEFTKETRIERGGKQLTLLVKITLECDKSQKILSYNIAFEDMTAVFQDKRQNAWSDIARRIAHEIKNPLTPIYLAAERIKQKYSKYIKDKKSFDMYVNTIMKHSQDIGTIVEEFSRFARMPAPKFNQIDLSLLIEEIFFSHQMKEPEIKFEAEIQENVSGFFDATQIRQMLINLIKNAEESIKSIVPDASKPGLIQITLTKEKNIAKIVIEDSGKGFDSKAMDKIFEPYFTTKTKGTGLGLAIVKKIVDDHEGRLIMKNSNLNHAIVEIHLPLDLNSER